MKVCNCLSSSKHYLKYFLSLKGQFYLHFINEDHETHQFHFPKVMDISWTCHPSLRCCFSFHFPKFLLFWSFHCILVSCFVAKHFQEFWYLVSHSYFFSFLMISFPIHQISYITCSEFFLKFERRLKHPGPTLFSVIIHNIRKIRIQSEFRETWCQN